MTGFISFLWVQVIKHNLWFDEPGGGGVFAETLVDQPGKVPILDWILHSLSQLASQGSFGK